MKITKEQVLTALRFEPLAAGNFIRVDGKPLSECNVCAVGAVMRNVLNKNIENEDDFSLLCKQVTKDEFIDLDTDELLLEGNYLGALSNYFEQMMDSRYEWGNLETTVATNTDRARLITFVEEKFPEEFEVNV